MNRTHVTRSMVLATIALISMVAVGAFATRASAASPKVIVPAYFSLATKSDGIQYDWRRIISAGTAVGVVVVDSTAAGGSVVSGDPCLDSLSDALGCLVQPSQGGPLVLLYVDSAFGCRPEACVEGGKGTSGCSTSDTGSSGTQCAAYATYGESGQQSDIDNTWATLLSHADGIFLDDGPQDSLGPGSEGLEVYYQHLHSHIEAKSCRGGAACKVMVNGSQFSQSWMIDSTVAEFATSYEAVPHNVPDGGHDGCVTSGWNQDYLTKFCPKANSSETSSCTVQSPENWETNSSNASKLAQILYDVSDSDFGSIYGAAKNGTTDFARPGYLYINNARTGACLSNGTQYNQLTTFFDQLTDTGFDVVLTAPNSLDGGTILIPVSL